MKITKTKLRNIIKEELLNEAKQTDAGKYLADRDMEDTVEEAADELFELINSEVLKSIQKVVNTATKKIHSKHKINRYDAVQVNKAFIRKFHDNKKITDKTGTDVITKIFDYI
jgi:hypothetical protein